MFTERTSVGLDVHARSIAAAAIDARTGELTRDTLRSDADVVLAWLDRLPGPVAVTYEAGPTGFWLARALVDKGLRCEVAAPSRLPVTPGNRVKTDRRDAVKLAKALHSDDITAVQVPTIAQEDLRDLTRDHDDARRALLAARHRMSALLLRHGIVYYGGEAWTSKHDTWLRRQREANALSGPGDQATFDDYYETVAWLTARRARLERRIAQLAQDSGQLTDIARRLACFRGISTLTSFALAVEIGDWQRFTGASIGAFLGLTPSEDSSGERIRRGPITKSGNTHARRLLVEAAWHHKYPYRAGVTLRRRWDKVTHPAVRARADAGNRRLARHRGDLQARGIDARTINTAIARELAGWCWSVAIMD